MTRGFECVATGLLAVLMLAGCKTPAEKQEEAQREQRMHERLDDIQSQLASIQERQQVGERAAAVPTLRPVVPVREQGEPAIVSEKDRIAALNARYGVKPVQKTGKSSRSKASAGSRDSLRAKHIRVPVDVRTIQQQLAAAGCSPGATDGRVGPKTIEAIREFQKKNGLKVDGVVGARTWERLRNVGAR